MLERNNVGFSTYSEGVPDEDEEANELVGRTDNSTNYFKYHKIVMSYGEAEKYIKAGWCLESVQKVLLKGIDKEYEECKLVWKQEGQPIIPPDLD